MPHKTELKWLHRRCDPRCDRSISSTRSVRNVSMQQYIQSTSPPNPIPDQVSGFWGFFVTIIRRFNLPYSCNGHQRTDYHAMVAQVAKARQASITRNIRTKVRRDIRKLREWGNGAKVTYRHQINTQKNILTNCIDRFLQKLYLCIFLLNKYNS